MTAWSVCPGAHLSSTGLASLVALDRVKGRPSTGLPTHEEQEQGVWSASPEAWVLLVRWGASPTLDTPRLPHSPRCGPSAPS